MRILAFDSAARHCSAAVVTPEAVLAEVSGAETDTHARRLMDRIHQVLSRCGLSLSDMDAIAVTHGPGSFTGLRIALSTAKGLAVAAKKPVIPVSTLHVLAFQAAGTGERISPLLDARKGEVYFSRYRFENRMLVSEMEESVGPPAAAMAGIGDACVFIGEGALRYEAQIRRRMGHRARFPDTAAHALRASAVGALGLEGFKHNPDADPGSVAPVYLRRADVRKATETGGIFKMPETIKKD